jgi:hypothetical protein
MSEVLTREFLEKKLREITRRYDNLIRGLSYTGGGAGGMEYDTTEILIGSVNGVNRNFRTTQPYKTGTIKIYLNGLKESYFSEISDTEILLEDAPQNRGFIDKVEATYIKLIN